MHSRRPIACHVPVVHSSIGRRPARVARARLGQPQGWGLPVEAQRCLFRRERVDHDACGCPAPLQRFYATAAARAHEMDANRAGVCDMGVQARGLLPARAGRRGPRGGLRAAKRRIDTRKTRPSVSQGKLALFIDLRARRQSRRKKAARDSLAASTACSKKHHSAHAAAARSPTHRREAAPAKPP